MSAEYRADVRPADQPPKRLRKRYRRDVRVLDDLDGRTAPARRARSLIARLRSGLNAGAEPTAAQGELVTRCAMLSILAGDCEIKVLRNQPIDIHAYTTLVNCQRRVLQALGIARALEDAKLVNGHPNPAFDHVWPQYRAAEAEHAERQVRSLEQIEAMINALPDDNDATSAPPTAASAPPTQDGAA